MNFSFFKKKKEPTEIKSQKTEITVGYSYEWNEDVPDEEKDTDEHPSRPLCKKLIELNRVYTRVDIEQMSQRLGYSVWHNKGGEGCRHRWVTQTIIKRTEL